MNLLANMSEMSPSPSPLSYTVSVHFFIFLIKFLFLPSHQSCVQLHVNILMFYDCSLAALSPDNGKQWCFVPRPVPPPLFLHQIVVSKVGSQKACLVKFILIQAAIQCCHAWPGLPCIKDLDLSGPNLVK